MTPSTILCFMMSCKMLLKMFLKIKMVDTLRNFEICNMSCFPPAYFRNRDIFRFDDVFLGWTLLIKKNALYEQTY